jgi:hypothetical protein
VKPACRQTTHLSTTNPRQHIEHCKERQYGTHKHSDGQVNTAVDVILYDKKMNVKQYMLEDDHENAKDRR